MNRFSQRLMETWSGLGPRFLPFADAATAELPLGRLLRLALFQVSVGMALVLLVGTLNRVMIVELKVPASLVSIMVALPIIFAPIRALIGFRSDTHKSALGWRRVPYIWMGTMVQFGGLAIMPFALLVLAGAGNASNAPAWIGLAAAGLSFLLVGAGIHTTQTVGLALACDLAPQKSQPNIVGLMYVMLLVGMIGSALIFGVLLEDYSPGRLIQVIQGSAVVTIVLNAIALWKQESREEARARALVAREQNFKESWATFKEGGQAIRRLIAVGFGTMAFSMNDVLLEPYGGELLNMSVSATTVLTATLALGCLFGFSIASKVLSNGYDPFKMASNGAKIGIPAFALIIIAAPLQSTLLFIVGVLIIGFGNGLFGHGTLTATMKYAPENQSGLALGAWGAVQATAAGIALGAGGVLRDIFAELASRSYFGEALNNPATGYCAVYLLEIMLLLITIGAMTNFMWPSKTVESTA
jgi:MFS transporter, BCD family, chlorophyll transporter